MTPLVQAAIIGGLCSAVPNLIGQLLNYRKLHSVGKEMDGMKDQLVESTRAGAFKAGQKSEKDVPGNTDTK